MSKVRVCFTLLLLLHFGAFTLMLLKVEPFHTFFYSFAWWSYIVLLAWFNHVRGTNSLLFDRPREFVGVFFLSIMVWLFFEAYNFRLQNWYYLGVPVERVLRWPGYVLAFGTVLPGIFETETVLSNLGVMRGLHGPGIRVQKALRVRMVLLGCLMMVAPLVSPYIFFPLVWVGLIFLSEPFLYASGDRSRSILREAEHGSYEVGGRFLLAGIICGILWEFWNYWAGSKWIYSIPFFNSWKIFEMPLPGYFGFAFFALECRVLYQLSLLARKTPAPYGKFSLILLLVVSTVSAVLVIRGIDAWTVVTFKVIWGS